ncbi:cupin domain-containing protein [Dickeya poaceiphila]|nr:cupin domain-containing protein [Dickeya poaceiphila]
MTLLTDTGSFKSDYLLLEGNASFSEALFNYSVRHLFRGIHHPEKDIKLLCFGDVYHPASETCTDGVLGFYTMAIMLLRKRTIVFNHLEKRIPEYYSLYTYLAEKHRILSHYNIYWSPAESAGAGAHTDDHDVVIVQLAGKKKWKFEREGITLKAGDILFVRKGTLHDPVTEDKHQSLHLTVGLVNGVSSFPVFPEPTTVGDHAGYLSPMEFFYSMGNLLGRGELILHTGHDVITEEGHSHIRFACQENVLELTKEVFHHIFERQSLTSFCIRPGAGRKDVTNLILSFYKTGIPVEIKGTS